MVGGESNFGIVTGDAFSGGMTIFLPMPPAPVVCEKHAAASVIIANEMLIKNDRILIGTCENAGT